jgi:hypothetical protein
VSGLGEIGYHTTMIESGWHLSRCGPAVDTCIESSLLDEMGSALVSASILPQVIEVDRHVSSVVGTKRTFGMLDDLSTAYGQNGRPDLVIAHSLAPHPPMLLDAECESQGPSPTRSSLLLAFEGWDAALIAERAQTFRDQVTCIDSLVRSFVQSLPAETGVVVVGDHGSEIRGQVSVPPLGWNEAMLRERLQTLAAVRFPGCEPSVRATIEVVPELLSCLGLEVEDPALSAQIMANVKQADGSEYPLYEIPPDQVRRLLPPG